MFRLGYFIIALSIVLLIFSSIFWLNQSAPTDSKFIERHTKNDKDSNEESKLKSYFLDLGRGESTIMITPEGKVILIDTGNKDHYKKLAFILEELKIKEIDYMFLTTKELDHTGAFSDVFDNYPIHTILIPSDTGIDIFDDITRDILRKFKNLVLLTDNKKIAIEEDLDIYSLYKYPLVLKIKYKENSILMMSDANFEVEEQIIKKYNTTLKSLILKVGNHGQSLTNSDDFIKTVNPQVAIILGGDKDDNSRPSFGVIERLTESWIDVYRNDTKGTILVLLDGEKYEINTHLNNY